MNLTILNFSENRQIQGATAVTGSMGNCQGILDGSIRRQLHDNRRAVEAMESDRDDLKELESGRQTTTDKTGG